MSQPSKPGLLGFPNLQAPFVDPATGILTPTWQQAFQELVSPPQAIKTAAVTASPFAFTADRAGTLVISGGTVSLVQLNRGRVTIPLGTGPGNFPVSKGDTITTTYSVAPAIYFYSE